MQSDGSTPEKQIEQILAIAPILPGQKSSNKNVIPPPHQSAETHAPITDPALTTIPTPSKPQPPLEASDLIDFGQNDGAGAAPSNALAPPDLLAAQTENNGQQQKELEETLRSTSTGPKPEQQGSLLNFHSDLRKNLPAVAGLKRQDTDTQSVDEFVDAQG